MSYTTKRFLFWKYRSHTYEWKEMTREFLEKVEFSPPITGCKELGSTPVTEIYFYCKECGERKSSCIDGHISKEMEGVK
jgi:hypothetical protein